MRYILGLPASSPRSSVAPRPPRVRFPSPHLQELLPQLVLLRVPGGRGLAGAALPGQALRIELRDIGPRLRPTES